MYNSVVEREFAARYRYRAKLRGHVAFVPDLPVRGKRPVLGEGLTADRAKHCKHRDRQELGQARAQPEYVLSCTSSLAGG